MHNAVLVSACLVLFTACVSAVTKNCNLYNGDECTTGFPLNFVYAGFNNVPNSQCRRTYQLQVNIASDEKGFQCTFTMDRPEHNKYIYSMALSATASAASSTTPYIYGRGLDAYIRPRSTSSTTSSYYSNYINLNNLHTHPDNNGYSTVTYRVENNKLTVSGTAGQSMRIGHPYWFVPTVSTTTVYIGLNRRYHSDSSEGSGLCKASCYTF